MSDTHTHAAGRSARRVGGRARRLLVDETGAATAEYAIATMAKV